MSFNSMFSVLPFDITALIIDIVGENKDINFLKELALVSHSFQQICSKHLFATVDLHGRDTNQSPRLASSKKGFLKLVKSRPNVVNYICKLTYKVMPVSFNSDFNDVLQLSPILSNSLQTTSRLNFLSIDASGWDWNTLPSFLTSAFSISCIFLRPPLKYRKFPIV